MAGPTNGTRARLSRDLPLKPSVLDRLIGRDDEPDRTGPTQVLREIKENIRRDLQDLLNTRRCCESWPEDMRELDASLLNYGLPDYTGLHLSAPSKHEKVRDILRRVIETFEPRLEGVSVVRLNRGEPEGRTLAFRIAATLRVVPIAEPIAYESTIDPLGATFTVRRAGA